LLQPTAGPPHDHALPPAPTRCGFVALVGSPNSGKSTLVNALVGTKVAIVSHKVQTTRVPVRGIAVVGRSQIVFVDTPGIFPPRRRLDRAMVTTAWAGAAEADIVALLVDARGMRDGDAGIVSRLAQVSARKILLINKIDLVDKRELLERAQQINSLGDFTATFMISALNGEGVGDVKRWLAGAVPEGPWLYPDDKVADTPMRRLAAEITREKLLQRLHQELPYTSTVETTSWTEHKDRSVRIEQTVFVERESQRKIILGRGGQMIRAIGEAARREIADVLGTTVHLFLFVKVREDWQSDPERYREMGLEFPRE
jgi:GTP-binding protein Era